AAADGGGHCPPYIRRTGRVDTFRLSVALLIWLCACAPAQTAPQSAEPINEKADLLIKAATRPTTTAPTTAPATDDHTARIRAEVVYLDAKTVGDLDKYHGKLKGAVVLVGAVRDLQARFDPLALRVTDSDLLKLADADNGTSSPPGLARTMTPSERQALLASTPAGRLFAQRSRSGTGPTSGPTTGPTTGPGRFLSPGRIVSFLKDEGAALMVSPSTQGDGGTFFVASVALPVEDPGPGSRPSNFPRPWAANAPQTVPQIVLAVEHYNRLLRMIEQGEKLKMAVDLKVQFHDEDLMAYNTVAE